MALGGYPPKCRRTRTIPNTGGGSWSFWNGPEKDTASKLCKGLLQQNELVLSLPKSLLYSYVQRDVGAKKTLTLKQVAKESYTYKRQGGLDVYAYVELEIVPMKINGLIIQEKLSEIMEFSDNVSKTSCWELIDSLPLILKAIIDYTKRYSLLDCQITLTGFRFHIVDYRNYAYYLSTLQCLKQIFGVLDVE